MLSDADTACVAIALALYLKERKEIRPRPKNGANEDHSTHTNLVTILKDK